MKKLKHVCWSVCVAALLTAVTLTLSSCGEDEPDPVPNGQEQVGGPNDNPNPPGNDNPTPDNPGNVTTNVFGTDLSDEACWFVGYWRVSATKEFSGTIYLLPNGKGKVTYAYDVRIQKWIDWSYDATTNLLVTTLENLQFVVNGKFEDSMTAVTVNGNAATWKRPDAAHERPWCGSSLSSTYLDYVGRAWRKTDGEKVIFSDGRFVVEDYTKGFPQTGWGVDIHVDSVTKDICLTFEYWKYWGDKENPGRGTITIIDAWTDHPVMTITRTNYYVWNPPFPVGTFELV